MGLAARDVAVVVGDPLTLQEVLAFERAWEHRRQHDGHKDNAIRATFGTTPIRYYQVLARLLDEPEALAADPVLVSRLRRVRDERRRR